jgi:hypothetical protein
MGDMDPGKDPASGTDSNHIVIELDTIRDLLIAPEFDPFSEKETVYMGQSALGRAIKRLKPGWTRRTRDVRLTILLPPDQITPGLQDQVQKAIWRFCRTKIEDNTVQLHTIRWNGIRGLPFSFMFLAVCVGIGTVFGNGLVPGVSEWLGSALSEGFYIIGWVSLWDPVETLLFDPLPVKRENKVLTLFLDMPIEIEPRR